MTRRTVLSLLGLRREEYDAWSTAVEERFAVLLPAGRPGSMTAPAARTALRRMLPERPGVPAADIQWVVNGGARVGHVWMAHADDSCVVRDVRLDDARDAPEVLGLVVRHSEQAGARALEAWAAVGDASQQALVDAGDFKVTSTTMAMPFDRPQPRPEGFALRPMTPAEFEAGQEADLEHYIGERTRNGESEAVARRIAEEQNAALLPDGLDTDGHRFWVGEAHGRRVGTIWLDLRRPYAFVYNVVVDEDARGRGHGRALMHAGGRAAQQAGATGIALNVFGDNAVARGLYDSLGYRPTQVGVRMRL